jgi:predicted PurR-regulated permease PerM
MPPFRPSPFSVLLSACLVTALLYLGKPFLFPLTLSILLAFLLAPAVIRLEAWGLKRAVAVSLVAGLAFAVIGFGFYVVAGQLVDLVNTLPGYRENLKLKIFGPLEHVSSVFATLARDLRPAAESQPATGAMPVEVVPGKASLFGMARDLAGSLLSPLGTAAIVIVYVVFFLFDWQSLRDRFIHLVGRGRLRIATQAIDDAARRVSRYLGAQLLVNATYGVPVGIGLYFIGIPNAPLWGLLAIVLRFIPYLGPWIAAALPLVLAFAISPSWTQPLATLALFIGMELVSNNIVEPWLYGASTGLSPTAIIVSATFWTWLWGAGGLLLATPLTVCLAVLGKYVPALGFLDILLGSQPPIAPEHRFYQRLLAGDDAELDEVISGYIERDAAQELFDDVILPALRLAEQDVRNGSLEPVDQRQVCRHLREALENIEGFIIADDDEIRDVVIIPSRSESDALAGAMLSFLLRARGVKCTWFSERALTSEVQSRLEAKSVAVLCLSALTSAAARRAGTIFKRLGTAATGSKLLGYWQGDRATAIERLKQPGLEVISRLEEAVRLIASQAGGISPRAGSAESAPG